MTKYTHKGSDIHLSLTDSFDVGLSLDCGQAFRWYQDNDRVWHGVAFGKYLSLYQQGDTVIFYNTTEEDFLNIWVDYFDLNRNYNSLYEIYKFDKNLASAIENYPGIRVLNQDPWEALCSFIISQNNNIPRIKGIIDRLCINFGEKLENGTYTFPTADKLAPLTVEDLAPLRSGFRAKYIIDAAQKVASGEVDLASLEKMPIEEARTALQSIKGVGPKVAECVLLFSCKKADAFPQDVWIKRAMAEYYPDGLPEAILPTCGIAQQYMFHSIRMR